MTLFDPFIYALNIILVIKTSVNIIFIRMTYAEQKGMFCIAMKKNQTEFYKLCLADALIKLMGERDYDTITVSEICETAGVGRTTFYRHLNSKSGKDELLIFKINYEWKQYEKQHKEEVVADKGFGMSSYIYESRYLFSMLYEKGLIAIILKAFETLVPGGETPDKNLSYLMSFFTYGYFGIIFQWIKYGFDETPEQVAQHIQSAINSAQGHSF